MCVPFFLRSNVYLCLFCQCYYVCYCFIVCAFYVGVLTSFPHGALVRSVIVVFTGHTHFLSKAIYTYE